MTSLMKECSLSTLPTLPALPALPFHSEKWGQFIADAHTLPFVCSHDYIPQRKTKRAAGWDLSASECVIIPARGSATVNTGLKIQIAPEHYGSIEGRSGLGFQHLVLPFRGIIDSDYRDELQILLLNHSKVDYEVKIGHAIAQLIIHRYETPILFRVDTLSSGFGPTGI